MSPRRTEECCGQGSSVFSTTTLGTLSSIGSQWDSTSSSLPHDFGQPSSALHIHLDKNLFECAICALHRSEQPQLPVDGSGRDSHVTQHCWRKDRGRKCQFVHTRTSFCNLRRRNLRADLIPAAHAFLFRFDKPKGQRTNESCICPAHQDRSAGRWICIWDFKQGIFVVPLSFPFGACKLMHFCQIHVYREYQSSVTRT